MNTHEYVYKNQSREQLTRRAVTNQRPSWGRHWPIRGEYYELGRWQQAGRCQVPVCGQQVDAGPPVAVQCGLHGCRGKWNFLVARLYIQYILYERPEDLWFDDIACDMSFSSVASAVAGVGGDSDQCCPSAPLTQCYHQVRSNVIILQ